MAFREEVVTVWTCDNCGRETVEVNGEGATGIFGRVSEATDVLLQEHADFYACRRRCISGAVKSRLDAQWNPTN